MGRTTADQLLIDKLYSENDRLRNDNLVLTRALAEKNEAIDRLVDELADEWEGNKELSDQLDMAYDELDTLWDKYAKVVDEVEYYRVFVEDKERQDSQDSWEVGKPFTIGVDWRP